MARLLIVDDDVLFCEALSATMQEEGHSVFLAHTLAKARELLKARSFAIAFIDVFLPDGNGLDLLAGLALLPDPPEAIVVTALGDPDGAESAITAGAWDYVQKPADMGKITLMVQRALQTRERNARKLCLTGSSGIVGECLPIRQTLVQMFEAAQSDTPVLVTGETGTGKELVARAIHSNSRRAHGPFVVVDCGAIAPTLLESELFGNIRGAFTGAAQSRHGLVMLANGGTLFLDEVGELPPEQQKVFLRVLQERTFRPIGSTEEVQSDFRVVAATNRALTEMAAGGRFRADLLFRLQGCAIEMPPVRMRGDDIHLLVQHALQRTVTQYGMKPKAFSAEAHDAFAAYSWPGNVRELLYAIERAALASHDEHLILLQHLPMHLRAQAARSRLTPVADPMFAPRVGRPFGMPDRAEETSGQEASGSHNPHPANAAVQDAQPSAVDWASKKQDSLAAGGADAAPPENWRVFQETTLYGQKRQYLLSLLQWSKGNIPVAAKAADLSRQRLYTLLREHGITRQWLEGHGEGEDEDI